MNAGDPRRVPAFVVRVVGEAGAGKSSLVKALADFPVATDEDFARLAILDDDEATEQGPVNAVVLVVRGAPGEDAVKKLTALEPAAKVLFVAVHATPGEGAREAWAMLAPPSRVYATATPEAGPCAGVDELRAALIAAAMEGIDTTLEEARRAKRPYATGIIAGAALTTGAEALLPGAAAFVLATQIGAVSSLYYLYTGKWISRAQAVSLLTVFATEAAGGSAFLIAKSFLLPPASPTPSPPASPPP